MFDLILENATIIDGLKTSRFNADVAILGDKIASIGKLKNHSAKKRMDISGQVLCPGFIDVHNHSDAWILKRKHFFEKTSQGFTTEIIMADGISYAPVDRSTVDDWIYYLKTLNGLETDDYSGWNSIANYMKLFEGQTAQNVATHIPYANVRTLVCGFGNQDPTAEQIKKIQEQIFKGMEEGAVGLSTGLEYLTECFASTDELVQASSAMKNFKGLYVTHVRYPLGTLNGVKEAVEIGARANVPVHISHLKSSDPKVAHEILNYIDKVASQEVDFSFDVYPYIASSSMLHYLLPYKIWNEGPRAVKEKLLSASLRNEFSKSLMTAIAPYTLDQTYIAWVCSDKNSSLIGTSLAELIQTVDKSPAEALCDLLIEEDLMVLLVFRAGDDRLVYPFLQHEKFMLGSDGIYHHNAIVHPRMFGSTGRLLGKCVREEKLFSLEEAVYKMTSFPAKRFGLKNRGSIQEGSFADLVVFDPETISDQATYENPNQQMIGIKDVFVNGTQIIAEGELIEGNYPGQVLRYHC